MKEWAPYIRHLNKWMDVTLYTVPDTPDTWHIIDYNLGQDSWIISRRSDCIRSWGVLQAYQEGCDYFITMDDDCYPSLGTSVLSNHIRNLTTPTQFTKWTPTLSPSPRGFPESRVGISHGLWLHIPDFDAETQLSEPMQWNFCNEGIIPVGQLFPMSSMNLAWRREMTPAMYFGLQGPAWPYDRFGDIWCGLVAKRVADQCGYTVTNGTPYVWHDRASDPQVNLVKEAPGKLVNRKVWLGVGNSNIYCTDPSPSIATGSLVSSISWPQGEYWGKLIEAYHIWIKLCSV